MGAALEEVPTCSFPRGCATLMPMPPLARTRNWLELVDAKSASVESAHTKVPEWLALARVPAAKARFVAKLLSPPGMVAKGELAATVLLNPRPMLLEWEAVPK